MTTPPLHLAVDIGPLYGHRTGVGLATDGMVTALGARDDIEIDPYLVSFRATAVAGHRKLPLPGIVASHLWARSDRPRADRWLRGIDVVHGTNYVAPPTGLPTVVSVYDCWFLRHPELASPLIRRAGHTLRRVVQRGGWVHTSSEATAREAADLLATDRIVTVHLGPPAAIAPLSELSRPDVADALAGRPFVLSIGTEERRKDLPLLIEAFAHVESADAQLVLVGAAGDDSDNVAAAIATGTSATRDRIHRLGTIEHDVKQWLLRQAAVLAYPSLDEGFGFPVLEGQLASTPVVARAVGAIPEIAGDGAALVDQRDAHDFAQAIDRVLTDGTYRLGLLEAGNRNVRRFTWAETASGLVDLYHRSRETA